VVASTHNYAYPTNAAQVHTVMIDWHLCKITGNPALEASTSMVGFQLSGDVINNIADVDSDFITIEGTTGAKKVVQAFWCDWGNLIQIRPVYAQFATALAAAQVSVNYIKNPTQFDTTTTGVVGPPATGDYCITDMADSNLSIACIGTARDLLFKDDEADAFMKLDAHYNSEIEKVKAKFAGDEKDPVYTKQFKI
jgi:hypothetical protein